MKKLIKLKELSPGDKLATVSLSWGSAGYTDILWRCQEGKKDLNIFKKFKSFFFNI